MVGRHDTVPYWNVLLHLLAASVGEHLGSCSVAHAYISRTTTVTNLEPWLQ